ncbi:MAG: hypothetical protein WAU36_18960 [Cyclobacteriaceae bacterium]
MFNSTSKINSVLESFFNSDQQITIKFKDNKSTDFRTFSGKELKKKYLRSCQFIIDRILYYQRIKERSLTNINNLFVNISANQFNKAIADRKRLTSIRILEELRLIEVNHNRAYRSKSNPNNLLGKPFPKSYKIGSVFYDQSFITIESDVHKDNIENGIKSDVFKDQTKTNKRDKSSSSRYTSLLESYLLKVHNQLGLAVEFYQITISSKTNWIYSPLAGMERMSRNKLIKKNGLVDIDICCAHPQFILQLINDHLLNSSYIPEFGEHGIGYFMQEFGVFKKLVLDNKLYDNLIHVFEKKGYWIGHEDRIIKYSISGKDYKRDKVKKIVMMWFASSNKRWNMVKHLIDEFPQVTHFIDWFNQGTTNRVLNTLMSKEADLINGITEHIATNHPESICCPIFDGFIVEEKYSTTVFDLLISKGSDMIGHKIMVKTKYVGDTINEIDELMASTATLQKDAKNNIDDKINQLEPLKTNSSTKGGLTEQQINEFIETLKEYDQRQSLPVQENQVIGSNNVAKFKEYRFYRDTRAL